MKPVYLITGLSAVSGTDDLCADSSMGMALYLNKKIAIDLLGEIKRVKNFNKESRNILETNDYDYLDEVNLDKLKDFLEFKGLNVDPIQDFWTPVLLSEELFDEFDKFIWDQEEDFQDPIKHRRTRVASTYITWQVESKYAGDVFETTEFVEEMFQDFLDDKPIDKYVSVPIPIEG